MVATIKEETVLVEITIDNWNKLRKIQDDYFENSGKKLTLNDVISELCYGRY